MEENIDIYDYINDVQLLNACRDVSISGGRLVLFKTRKFIPVFDIFFLNYDSRKIIYSCAKIKSNFGY
jgi:hypothetical protein